MWAQLALALASPAMRLAMPIARLTAPRLHEDCSDGAYDPVAWMRAACWEDLTNFDRMVLLRGLLDGDVTSAEANHALWRGLGYEVGADGRLYCPDGVAVEGGSGPPDVLGNATAIMALEAELPLDDEDEMGMLDTLIETLHGETLTQELVAESDADFLARRTVVRWLYLTQPLLQLL